MARLAYSENSALDDTMPTDAFELIFGAIPGLVGGQGADSETLRLRCQAASLPGLDNEVMTATLGGFDYVYAGKNTFPKTLGVTFLELAKTMPVHRALVSWQQAVRGTESGTSLGYLNDYSTDARLIVYDTAGVASAVIQFEKLFPTSVPDIQLDGTGGSQPLLVTATFTYGRWFRADVPTR